MIGIIFKYFFIIFCSVYIFTKLDNRLMSLSNVIQAIIFSAIFSIIAYLTRKNFSFLTLTFILVALTIFLILQYKNKINKTLVFSIISIGICYIVYTISTLSFAPVCYAFFSNLNPHLATDISYILIGIFQIVLCYLLFKIKRLKNGVKLYENKLTGDPGIFISVTIILIASLFDEQKGTETMKTVILFCVILVGLLLFLWIKRYITNIYLEKVYKRNIEILENSLAEQQEINNKLKKSNEELSSIIHRDNKLIPAMESAVEEILECNSPCEQKEKSQALLSQLKSMSSERRTILSDYENLHKTLVQTGIFSVDASLKYLMNRAVKDNTAFDVSVAGDIKEPVKALISENDLNTLILDLGENALIAVRDSDTRNVLIVFGTENESFTISIFDSGLPFEQKVIENLGKRRITTHRKTGGSGIGLMTTAQLLKKHNASLVIDESIDTESYAKKVSVIFDGLSQCRIVTPTNTLIRLL